MPSKKLNVHEVLCMLEDEDFFNADIFITPPNDPTQSDEDSADEEESDTGNKFTVHQLEATAEVSLRTKPGGSRQRISVMENNLDNDADTIVAGETVELERLQFAETPKRSRSAIAQGFSTPRVRKPAVQFSDQHINSDLSDNAARNTLAPVKQAPIVPMLTRTSRRNTERADSRSSTVRFSDQHVNNDSSRDASNKAPAPFQEAPSVRRPTQASKRKSDDGPTTATITTTTTTTTLASKKTVSKPRSWVKQDLSLTEEEEESVNNVNRYANSNETPATIFEKFFDEEVIQMLVDNTIRYAVQKGKESFTITPSEFRLFIAILFTSGYVQLPRRRMFWENSDDVHNSAVSLAMSRNRFEEILSCVHVVIRIFIGCCNAECLAIIQTFSCICQYATSPAGLSTKYL